MKELSSLRSQLEYYLAWPDPSQFSGSLQGEDSVIHGMQQNVLEKLANIEVSGT